MEPTNQYKTFRSGAGGCGTWASLAFLFFLALACAIMKQLGG